MVGEGVLHVCLHHPDVESVLVISRKPCGLKDDKLKEILHNDFFDYTTLGDRLKGYNACFFCLGVTSVGKTEEEYTRLTYDLAMAAARTLAHLNRDMTFCYVSGAGTDSSERGRSMWARVKGKTENDLAKLSFKAAYAFRPGFIKPIKGMKNTLAFAKPLGAVYPENAGEDESSEDLGNLHIEQMRRMHPRSCSEHMLSDPGRERWRVEQQVDRGRRVEDRHRASRSARTAVALSSTSVTEPSRLIRARTSSTVGRSAYRSISRRR